MVISLSSLSYSSLGAYVVIPPNPTRRDQLQKSKYVTWAKPDNQPLYICSPGYVCRYMEPARYSCLVGRSLKKLKDCRLGSGHIFCLLSLFNKM